MCAGLPGIGMELGKISATIPSQGSPSARKQHQLRVESTAEAVKPASSYLHKVLPTLGKLSPQAFACTTTG
jgi:hypothetical protein